MCISTYLQVYTAFFWLDMMYTCVFIYSMFIGHDLKCRAYVALYLFIYKCNIHIYTFMLFRFWILIQSTRLHKLLPVSTRKKLIWSYPRYGPAVSFPILFFVIMISFPVLFLFTVPVAFFLFLPCLFSSYFLTPISK